MSMQTSGKIMWALSILYGVGVGLIATFTDGILVPFCVVGGVLLGLGWGLRGRLAASTGNPVYTDSERSRRRAERRAGRRAGTV